MDNVITGVETVQQAEQVYKKSKQTFYEAGMNLMEWKSNNTQVMDLMLVKYKANETCMKMLGQNWDSEADTLSVKPVKMLEMSFVTKRTVLKQVAKLFDHLRMFAPVTLKGKLFLQMLWGKQIEWDEKLSKADKEMWFEAMLPEGIPFHQFNITNYSRCLVPVWRL